MLTQSKVAVKESLAMEKMRSLYNQIGSLLKFLVAHLSGAAYLISFSLFLSFDNAFSNITTMSTPAALGRRNKK